MTTPWPFSAWGIDIIGPINPKSSEGYEYILVAIDYFTKWIEAKAYKKLGAKQVAKFIKKNLICRYGVPFEMVSDNGTPFQGEVIKLLKDYKIQHHRSSPYRPQMNGAVEAANKNIKKTLAKMIKKRRDWAEQLPIALWGYRTTTRTSTGATPFSLVYGTEAVLPVEIEQQSLRVVLESRLKEEDWEKARKEEIMNFDEQRLKALCHLQSYQRRLIASFSRKVKDRRLNPGDLVLKTVNPNVRDPLGKFKPNWEGPYVIRNIWPGGGVELVDMDGKRFTNPINKDRLKKYYA